MGVDEGNLLLIVMGVERYILLTRQVLVILYTVVWCRNQVNLNCNIHSRNGIEKSSSRGSHKKVRGKRVAMGPTRTTYQDYGTQRLLMHGKNAHGPRVRPDKPRQTEKLGGQKYWDSITINNSTV